MCRMWNVELRISSARNMMQNAWVQKKNSDYEKELKNIDHGINMNKYTAFYVILGNGIPNIRYFHAI